MKNMLLNIYNIQQLLEAKLVKKEMRGVLSSSRKRKKLLEFYKDLKMSHNHSWYEEVYERNKHNLEKVALFYRGNKITYDQLFERVEEVAKSLKYFGVLKGDELPVCMSNTPELIYVLLAASKIGAKLNIFGADYDQDYIKSIINSTHSDILIATDDQYSKIKDLVKDTNVKKKIISSLADSVQYDQFNYWMMDDPLFTYRSKVQDYQDEDSTVMNFIEFVQSGKNYKGMTLEKGKLNDEFLITYTSGSTQTTCPKAIVHRNRSLIAMAMSHDTRYSALPSMKGISGLAYIPPHSNTGIISSVSDVLCQCGIVALEPIYCKFFFLTSLIINQVNMALATRSHYIQAIKDSQNKEKYPNGVELRELYVATSVGEPTSKNELRFIDQGLARMKAGLNHLPRPLGPARLSTGGGDCEHGGLYFQLFQSLRDKFSICGDAGMKPFLLAKPIVLKADGSICKPNELGRLAADSICTMKGYNNNRQATEEFYIKDKYGRKHGDQKVWAYLDKGNSVHMKGRMGNELIVANEIIPTFEVADVILKDIKNILSCEVVNVTDNTGQDTLVAHIELQPDSAKLEEVLKNAYIRLQGSFSLEVISRVLFRVRSNQESFPLTGCGKRNVPALEAEGVSCQCLIPKVDNDCISFSKYLENNQIEKTKRFVKS